jgi:hypothetical protein
MKTSPSKALMLLFAAWLAPMFAHAQTAAYNPMFGDKQNQFALYAGGSTGTGALNKMGTSWVPVEDMGEIELRYAQPTTFFRLPARQSVDVAQIIDLGDSKHKRTQPVFGLMQEFLFLPNFEQFYAGFGLGIYLKQNIDDRIDSRFTFGEKLFVGHRFNDEYAVELYWRHFSNGDLTPINHAYNFIGLGATWSF